MDYGWESLRYTNSRSAFSLIIQQTYFCISCHTMNASRSFQPVMVWRLPHLASHSSQHYLGSVYRKDIGHFTSPPHPRRNLSPFLPKLISSIAQLRKITPGIHYECVQERKCSRMEKRSFIFPSLMHTLLYLSVRSAYTRCRPDRTSSVIWKFMRS